MKSPFTDGAGAPAPRAPLSFPDVRLPPLRVVLSPFLGLGTDVRVRVSRDLNCFMALEASVAGHSQVGFGVEPTRLPWLRLQLAPTLQLSLRAPLALLAPRHDLLVGGALTLSKAGALRPLDASSPGALASSLRALAAVCVELQHRPALADVLLDDRARAALRASADEFAAARQAAAARSAAARRRISSTLDPPGMPAADPRDNTASAGSRTLEQRRRLNARARELARRARIDTTLGPFADEFRGDKPPARRVRELPDDAERTGEDLAEQERDPDPGFITPPLAGTVFLDQGWRRVLPRRRALPGRAAW